MQHKIILLRESGTWEMVYMDHKKLHLYYGNHPIAFCGGLQDCVFVCRSIPDEKDGKNCFAEQFPQYFEAETHGDVLVVGSDENGAACDVDVECVMSALKS